jgi:DNA repair exonuclease SbcCD nuclease subunit
LKLLVTSDWHDDAVTLGIARRPELLRYVAELKRAIVAENVQVAINAGDFADPGSMLASEYAADIIRELYELGATTSVGGLVAIAGNHDVVEVDRPLTTLSPFAEVLRLASFDESNMYVAEVPRSVRIENVAFLCLPYLARAYAEKQRVDLDDAAFEQARAFREDGCKIVVVGHRTVAGARCGSESAEMARGRDLDLPIARIAELKPELVFNGHYHIPQIVRAGHGIEVAIPGSPLAYTTDDESAGKGYIVAEI